MKKLTALMLAAAMSMTALTACGSKTEESAAAPASTDHHHYVRTQQEGSHLQARNRDLARN